MNLARRTISIYFFGLYTLLFAQAPAGYYNTAVGKKGAELKTALHTIIKDHTVLEYYSSSTSFQKTDWHPDGYFWDMYSNNKRASWSGMNREHNLPKSWWSTDPETTIAYTDLQNLYPSDATANTAKSNYPLGVVGGTPTFSNGVVKVGSNSYPGYSGTVFEPANEYKGDFARDYMYVVTCYEDYANNWRSLGTSSMLYNGGTYPVFRPYAVNLLLEWSRNDPVSDKEINRNNAVYELQGNRNPFIDFQSLTEYIWGKYIGESWPGDDSQPETDATFYLSYNAADKTLFVKVNQPETTTYSIYSISGVLLKTADQINSNSKIEVSTLDKGMYIVKFYSGTKRKTGKFVVN
jgi:endonuclease I